MKGILLLAFPLLSCPLLAQITIGQNDMVGANDSVRVSYSGNGTASVDHTLSGPNYLWDFSALQPAAQEMLRYDAPSAIPFNFLSTVAVHNSSPDSIPFIGAVPTNFTDYYKNGSSGYRQNGISFNYAPIGNLTIPVIFSSNDYIYKFPLDYGDLDTSDAAYSFNIPNMAYIGENIHRTSNVDGWGTLMTPYGTFQCLRVVSYVDRVDTIGLDSVNGFTAPRPTEVEYKWLAAGRKIPVLEVDCQVLLSNEVVTNVIYQDSLRDSVFQVGIPEQAMSVMNGVYPNPTDGPCTVAYTLQQSSPVSFALFDLSGRCVQYSGTTEETAGSHTLELSLEGLAPGLYQLRMTAGNGFQYCPVIVAK